MNKKFISLLLSCFVLLAGAQDVTSGTSPQMADLFRQEGKIYVVIAVIAMVFVFIVAMLVYLERKLKHLEKKFNDKLNQSGQ